MKYRTHNDEHINAAGTSHKADITTTYSKLVELFGEPRKASGDGKVDAEWKIEFENGETESVKEGNIIAYPKTLNDRLGIFYSNNINPKTNDTIVKSLKQLEIVSKCKADIYTCMWRSEPENPFKEYIAWTQTFFSFKPTTTNNAIIICSKRGA